MAYAIEAEIADPEAETWVLKAQKIMHSGRRIVGLNGTAASFLAGFFS